MAGQAHCLKFPECMELGVPPECGRGDCPTKVNRVTLAKLFEPQDDILDFKIRITEVLHKYGIALPDVPVAALAEAMQRMAHNRGGH